MKFVIVGNGISGTTAARMAAEHDSSAEIAIYTNEPYLYYPRPKLVDLLAGKVELAAMPQYPPDWYAKRGLQVHLNTSVISLDTAAHKVILSDASQVTYDRLILANGASNYIPPFAGANLGNVLSLRSLDDALLLRDKSRTAKNTVILGGGLLGLDLAAALQTNGTQVTVVEMMPRLLPRQLDTQGAAVLTDILTRRGLNIITGDSCAYVIGRTDVDTVHFKSGRLLPADLVAVSAGICPNIDLAKAAGIECSRGVLVDQHMQTSASGVFAIGDVAEYNNRVWGLIPVALAQAKVAVAAAYGDSSVIYQSVAPSTTLKVTDVDLTSIGEVNPENNGVSELRQEKSAAGIYKKLVIRGGIIIGAILLGDRSNLRTISQLIEKKIPVTGHEEHLFNPDLDLESLVSL